MGTPSLFVTPDHARGRRNEPPLHPPATRWGKLAAVAPRIEAGLPRGSRRPGGRRSPRRRTIPRRRSAAPSGMGEQPFPTCSLAANPARRSPKGAANRQRLPHRVGTPDNAAPRGGRRQQSGRSSTRCGSETGSEPAACRPCHAGSPGTPAHAHPPRSSRPGVSARSSPAARPPCWPGTHSLSGPRRCPRSMTPGTAAAPAPGCWLRCLRSMRSGTAAEKLLQPEAAKGYGTEAEAAAERGLILRITWLQLYAIAKAIGVQRLLHSYNSRYTHNRPRRAAAASGQGLRAAAARLLLLPSAERPSAAARCCSSPGRASGSGRRRIAPQLLHAAAAAEGRARQGGALAHPAAPAHLPTQRKQQQSLACRPGFPAAVA